MTSSYAHELRIAQLAVQRASILSKRVLTSVNKGELSKSDESPVTIADFAIQAAIISALHKAFPSDGFVGEESADALRENPELQKLVWDLVSTTHLDDEESENLLTSPSSIEEVFEAIDLGGRGAGGSRGRVWMMDPIDGTATFIRGEQYAVSLALIVDGVEVVGVLGCPNLSLATGRVEEKSVDSDGMGLMLSAVRGEGATVRPMETGAIQPGQKIERSPDGPKDLKDLHFVNSTRNIAHPHPQGNIKAVADKFGAAYPGTEVWSSHIRYAALIVGGADVQIRMPVDRGNIPYVWDHAGAQLIFTEVGGKITDLEGKKIDFGAGKKLSNNWGMVAAREGVHAKVFEVVREILRSEGLISS
ncbi:hypothetical protein F5884DRAFT_763346 [Xylogone sp. PMI_703]|nr:hypothetical protein F5884DRAFT_763346 [Xylogone sp. PMI_703]